MKVIFMGTPEFAAPSLAALYEAGHKVLCVFTQPDKPQNRGMKVKFPPVKDCALEHRTTVYQPASLRDGEALRIIKDYDPELIVVVAYGKILPEDILNCPKYGCVNVHASLLPKYRGAAPIQWAVINGERSTGVTTMFMDKGLDTGDMIFLEETEISPDETAGELHDRLKDMGACLLKKTVSAIESGSFTRTPQDDAGSCYAPMLTKELCPIDWSMSALQIKDRVRGLNPWPVATAALGSMKLKVFSVKISDESAAEAPGSILGGSEDGIAVACGGGIVCLTEVQAEGGKRMSAAEYLRGHPLENRA